jgi:hypothetical protein
MAMALSTNLVESQMLLRRIERKTKDVKIKKSKPNILIFLVLFVVGEKSLIRTILYLGLRS